MLLSENIFSPFFSSCKKIKIWNKAHYPEKQAQQKNMCVKIKHIGH